MMRRVPMSNTPCRWKEGDLYQKKLEDCRTNSGAQGESKIPASRTS